jgi:hypothetical protein
MGKLTATKAEQEGYVKDLKDNAKTIARVRTFRRKMEINLSRHLTY